VPFCPVCRYEFRPGFTQCGDCGATLVDELPPVKQRAELGSSTDVVIARADGQAMAQMWAELLGRHGISCRLVPITPAADGLVPTNSVVEVRVAAILADRARRLVPRALRKRRRAEAPKVDRVLDDVDRAIARGELELAEDLLDSIEDEST
jgi:hypothetical protein